jgi:hypothetical protein
MSEILQNGTALKERRPLLWDCVCAVARIRTQTRVSGALQLERAHEFLGKLINSLLCLLTAAISLDHCGVMVAPLHVNTSRTAVEPGELLERWKSC